MKKTICLLSIWVLLSIFIFLALVGPMIIEATNDFNDDLSDLMQTIEVLKTDFEQVYLQNNYNIYPKDDLIIVSLKQNNCELLLHYTQNRVFIDYEVNGPPAYTNNSVNFMMYILSGALSITLALGLILTPIHLYCCFQKHKALKN